MATAADMAIAEAAASEITESLKRGQNISQLASMLEEFQKDSTVRVSEEAENTVTLYHNLNGSPHVSPVYMVAKLLQRRFPKEDWVPDTLWGKPVFSTYAKVSYQMGSYYCFLNPKHPDRAKLDAFGLAGRTCKRDAIPSQLDVEMHMQRKHRSEWAIIQREDARTREDEYRKMQLEQMKAFSKLAEGVTVNVPEAVEAKRGRGRPRKVEPVLEVNLETEIEGETL